MASDEIRRLRAEIAKKHKAVTNKIKRTEKISGAKVGGSEFDPRRSAGAENRMRSESRMREYLGELNHFMRRGNQFVGGAEGAPLPRGYFMGVYKKNEVEVEANRIERDRVMGGVQGPEGFTIRDFQTALPKAGGSSKYGPYRQFDRSASDITSFEALKKLNADMVKRLSPNYVAGEIDSGRNAVIKVAEYIGDSDIADNISRLTDEQFDLIWFGTTFAARLFMYYDLEKEREDGNYKERNQDKVVESKFAGIGELIQWAKEQNPGK